MMRSGCGAKFRVGRQFKSDSDTTGIPVLKFMPSCPPITGRTDVRPRRQQRNLAQDRDDYQQAQVAVRACL